MNSYISVYTLTKFNSIIDSYKRNILKDFYTLNNINEDYQTYENKYIENTPTIYNIKKTKDINKCHAYVYKKHFGKVQCNNSIKNDLFCGKHAKYQNYGIINF